MLLKLSMSALAPLLLLILFLTHGHCTAIHQEHIGAVLEVYNISHAEVDVLHELYNATNGDSWAWHNTGGIPWNFTADANPCADHWQGITCLVEGTSAFIEAIILTSHNLSGTIPPSISTLPLLQKLALDHNFLTSSIPSSLGELPLLSYLELGTNILVGTIPLSLCHVQTLTVLQLYDNQLNGSIPSCFSNLTILLDLDLDTNLLTGHIPPSLGDLEHLRLLYVNNNSLSGPILESFGNLKVLETLFLSNNSLTGTIPASLGDMTEMVFFSLYNNSLKGTIPASLGQLSNLQGLNFDVNQLTGSIPSEIGNLHSLLFLNLHSNLLTGSFPASIFQIQTLEYLDMHNNSLTGTLSQDLGQLGALTYFDFGTNFISGTIPQSVGASSRLVFFTLEDNLLTGTIPKSIASLPSLYVLLLQNNYLSGPCNDIVDPTTQVNLTTIQLSNNQLSGPFPTTLFQLPSLTTFASVSNCFTGTLSDAICQGSALRTLALDGMRSATSCQVKVLPGVSDAYVIKYVYHHNIAGPLPTCLLQMPQLTTLHVSGNGLTGTIPNNLPISASLSDLSLSHNALSGDVPVTIQERPWFDLDISYNSFAGELSSSFALYARNASLRMNNNKFSGAVPGSLRDTFNISVLQGNLFSCALDRSDLPHHDPDIQAYGCGSDSFNVLYYTWLGFSVLSVALVATLWRYRAKIDAFYDLSGLFVYIARCLAVQREMMSASKEADLKLQPLQYVMDVGDALCKVGAITTALLVFVVLPVYAAMSVVYSTHAHTYAWTVSPSYTAGSAPLGAFMCSFLVLMGVFACVFLVYTQRCTYHRRQRRMRVSQTLETAAVQQKSWLERTFYCACIMVLVMGVVLGVNIAFVVVSLYESFAVLTLAQILLSIFKLGWNNALSPSLKKWTTKHLITSKLDYMSMQLFVALFNNISIPCMVVAIISPDCFYTLFVAAAPVEAQYVFEQCAAYSQMGCVGTADVVAYTSYAPPFSYSFQCSASLLSYYVPVFVYMCIIVTFIDPALQWASYRLYVRYRDYSVARSVLENFVATAFSSMHEAQEREQAQVVQDQGSRSTSDVTSMADGDEVLSANASTDAGSEQPGKEVLLNTTGSVTYFDAPQYITAQLSLLGLLLTFGTVYPPLAAAVLAAMYATAFAAKLKVGHTLCLAQTLRQHDCFDVLAANCAGVGTTLMMHRALWTIVAFAFAFYTQFLFDTLGYDEGARNAIWVVIVTPMIGFCMYFAYAGAMYRAQIVAIRGAPDGNIELKDLAAEHEKENHVDQSTDVYNVMQTKL